MGRVEVSASANGEQIQNSLASHSKRSASFALRGLLRPLSFLRYQSIRYSTRVCSLHSMCLSNASCKSLGTACLILEGWTTSAALRMNHFIRPLVASIVLQGSLSNLHTREALTASPKSMPISGAKNAPSGRRRAAQDQQM